MYDQIITFGLGKALSQFNYPRARPCNRRPNDRGDDDTLVCVYPENTLMTSAYLRRINITLVSTL